MKKINFNPTKTRTPSSDKIDCQFTNSVASCRAKDVVPVTVCVGIRVSLDMNCSTFFYKEQIGFSRFPEPVKESSPIENALACLTVGVKSSQTVVQNKMNKNVTDQERQRKIFVSPRLFRTVRDRHPSMTQPLPCTAHWSLGRSGVSCRNSLTHSGYSRGHLLIWSPIHPLPLPSFVSRKAHVIFCFIGVTNESFH